MQRAIGLITAILVAACGGPEEPPPIQIEPVPMADAVDAPIPDAPADDPTVDDPAPAVPEAELLPDSTPFEEPTAETPTGIPPAAWRHDPPQIIVEAENTGWVDVLPELEQRPPSQAPVLGGTLWVNPAGTLAVVTAPAHDQVFFIDLQTQRILAQHHLPQSQPWRIVEHDGAIWVSLRRSGEVARFDAHDRTLIARHQVCGAPRGMAYDGRADVMRIACAGGELVSLDPTDGTEVERATLRPDLRDVVVTDDHLLVSTFRTPQVLVVRNGQVVDYWEPNTARQDGRVTALPTVAWRMVPGPNRSVIMMHQRSMVDEVSISRPSGYGGVRGRGCGAGLVETVATQFTSDGFVRAEAVLSDAHLPVDVAVLGAGDLMVASGVSVDNRFGQLQQLGIYRSGVNGITGCQQAADSDPTAQHHGVVAVAADDEGVRYAIAVAPLRLIRHLNDRPLRVDLPVGAEHPGRTLFHTLTPAQIACASCHPEGGDDGHVWTFERLGERRTQHLRGGLSAPFHWDGEFADMTALVTEVMGSRMGMGRLLTPGDGEVMADWLDGLPAWRDRPAVDREQVQRGAQIYADPDVGCTSCHSMIGDPVVAENVDVGTGGLFQVPTLKGVALRPPFLHDGCAATLHDRFSACGGGDDHGRTSHLDDEAIDALVAFLRTL